jgi:hypothetical protein
VHGVDTCLRVATIPSFFSTITSLAEFVMLTSLTTTKKHYGILLKNQSTERQLCRLIKSQIFDSGQGFRYQKNKIK